MSLEQLWGGEVCVKGIILNHVGCVEECLNCWLFDGGALCEWHRARARLIKNLKFKENLIKMMFSLITFLYEVLKETIYRKDMRIRNKKIGVNIFWRKSVLKVVRDKWVGV